MRDEQNNYGDSIIRRDHQRTLRFNTLSALHDAIRVYGGARPAALHENLRQIRAAHGTDAKRIAFSHLAEGGGSFADRVVEAMGSLEKRYYGSWDYDGPGPFHKCSIEAQAKPDTTFVLSIHAAYVGNEAEIALAEKVRAPLGYAGCSLERTWIASNDRFAIPLQNIEAAYIALGQSFDAQAFLKAITTPRIADGSTDHIESHTSPVTILDDGPIRASLSFINYRQVAPYDYQRAPSRDYEYRLEDGALTGPALLDRNSGRPRSIGLRLWIVPATEGLTYETALEQRIRGLGDAAQAAWEGSNSWEPAPHSP